MKDYLVYLGFGIAFAVLAACATVEDVNRASELIRTDNELTRLLTEVRPSDQAGSSVYLMGLAANASETAKKHAGSADAIAFYRIAATAYWRSGDPKVTEKLFSVTNSGQEACKALGDKAPDRDCLFLKFVIPFAGLESASKERQYITELADINFFDRVDTGKEIKILEDSGQYLRKIKNPVESILKFGSDPVLSTHTEMREYYCDNAEKAYKHYDNIAASLLSKTKSYYDRQSGLGGSSTISTATAEGLRKLDNIIPEFCNN